MKNETRESRSGVIPVAVIITIAIASMFIGAGLWVFIMGGAEVGILLFVLGVIVGLFLLPNLPKVIKWMKNVKKAIF